jgi:hypothetical protein
MTARLVATLLPYVIVAMLALALVLFALALQQLHRGRTGPYWRLRRQAGQRGGQLFLVSVTLFGLALTLAFFSGLADLALNGVRSALSRNADDLRGVVIPSLTDLPTIITSVSTTVIPTTAQPTRMATSTALPYTLTATNTPTPTPTLTPTMTATPTVTATPTPTFEHVLALTPAVSDQAAPRGAAIEIVGASAELAADGSPVEQSAEFTAGIQRIYFFVRFDNMANGVAWTRVLLREGVPIQGQSYLWSMGEAGESFFFFGDADGYPPGSYEVQIFIGQEEVSRFAFSIAGL